MKVNFIYNGKLTTRAFGRDDTVLNLLSFFWEYYPGIIPINFVKYDVVMGFEVVWKNPFYEK